MRARSIALLMLALGCGLVASIGITQVIGNRDTEPADQTGDAHTIFVALEDIPFGKPLTPELLRLESWPKDKVPSGAFSRIEDVEGRRTRTKLYAGEPVLENRLSPKGASGRGVSGLIPKGYRVVAVKVDRVSGSGLILPEDRVDVLLHLIRNPPRGILKTSTRTILQDVKVFAVNDVVETEGQDDKTITAQTISLLVSPEHAQLVMLAEELGKIRLIMRSGDDDKITTVQDTTPSELLSAAGAEDRQNEIPLAASGPNGAGASFLKALEQWRAKKVGPEGANPPYQPIPPGSLHRMRIVSGLEVKDVVLEKDADRSNPASGFELWRVRQSQPASDFDPAAGTPQTRELVTEEGQDPTEEDKPQQQPQEEQKEDD